MALYEAVNSLDSSAVRKLLDEGFLQDYQEQDGQSLLHVVVNASLDVDYDDQLSNPRSEIIFMLVDAGVDLEKRNDVGLTCLWCAAQNNDVSSCETLLQCGADMHLVSESGASLLDEVFRSGCKHKHRDSNSALQEVFKKYYPGLWQAVEQRDICQVRRLTNLWCRTDLEKEGKSLKELALDGGHEEIISLVFGIHDTMKLIHRILAKNRKAVAAMFETPSKSLQLDLRKMSERGAPILYYLIQWQDAETIELFVRHGCHVYTIMRDELGFDMPVLFSSLHDNMPVKVIESLLPRNKPHQEEMLYKLLYKGRTILQVALENLVSLEVFDVLVDRGGPLLVMDRNESNQSVRDIAVVSGREDYTNVIDKNVALWIVEPEKYPGRRQALALYGWDHMRDIPLNGPRLGSAHVDEFLCTLSNYQDQLCSLAKAIENGDLEMFHEIREFNRNPDLFESVLSWDGRMKGDGMPFLHRAVIFNHPELVSAILNDKPQSQSVDTLFDQYHRTALHYAYASASHAPVRRLLLDSGCSEHVLDRRNKEPLDFKDKQDTELMNDLLERLRSKNYSSPEPDPWSEPETLQTCFSSQSIPNAQSPICCQAHDISDAFESQDFENDEEYVENDTDSEQEEDQRWRCIIS